MATPTDTLDPPAVMSYGGLVDAATAEGQAEAAADWASALAESAAVRASSAPAAATGSDQRPARHLAHITRRRGAYSPTR